jgi:hypothetical protein
LGALAVVSNKAMYAKIGFDRFEQKSAEAALVVMVLLEVVLVVILAYAKRASFVLPDTKTTFCLYKSRQPFIKVLGDGVATNVGFPQKIFITSCL